MSGVLNFDSIGRLTDDLVVETRSNGETPMELFTKLFGSLLVFVLVFVYHCFDRIVIHTWSPPFVQAFFRCW
jgi:hypothetical protein